MPGFVETLEGQASSFGVQANGESVVASCILFLLLPACGEKKRKHRKQKRCSGRRAFEVHCCVFRIIDSFVVGKRLFIYQYKSDKILIFLKAHGQI